MESTQQPAMSKAAKKNRIRALKKKQQKAAEGENNKNTSAVTNYNNSTTASTSSTTVDRTPSDLKDIGVSVSPQNVGRLKEKDDFATDGGSLSGLIDIGINLNHRSLRPQLDELLDRAVQKGVECVIATGTSLKGSIESQKLAKAYNAKRNQIYIYSTAGIHPHDAKSCNNNTIQTLRSLASQPEVIAIGECGLDFDRNFSPPEVQMKWFSEQIELACDLQMPLFLHERAAHDDFLRIMKNYQNKLPPSVVHCFTGNEKELNAYIKMDFYIGITGWICDERRGKELQNIVKNIPLDRIMIETDAPFLTPRNIHPRPKHNEPCFLSNVLYQLAECMNVSPSVLSKCALANTKRFFKI